MGRRILVVLLVPYVAWLVLDYDYHFIDGVNLVFHEAGHLVFTPFGRTMHFLGGSIGQLFFPVALIVYFLREEKRFEAAICGLWAAESVMYIAWYMADAKAMAIPLVGGGIHDWNWLLSRYGGLESCERLAAGVHLLASFGAIGALIAAGRVAFEPGSDGEAVSERGLTAMLASEFPDEASAAQVPDGLRSGVEAQPAPGRKIRGAAAFGGPPRR
ncbi:MAG: hypothetical protein QNK05_17490 [Myxococcota bacterium]|nr:hypothetical protein [Myxococcota bacterium]